MVLEAFALLLLIGGPAGPPQQPAASLMTPLEHISDPLKQALSSLTHAANQTCEVKAAIGNIKAALKDVAAGETFLAQHDGGAGLPPLPPETTPDFTPPPRPAPRRNEMLEAALKNVKTAFERLTEAPGAGWGGQRDTAYRHLDEAANNLILAIKNANAAFAKGTRDLPSCKPDGN
jgi:hypothetical protein